MLLFAQRMEIISLCPQYIQNKGETTKIT